MQTINILEDCVQNLATVIKDLKQEQNEPDRPNLAEFDKKLLWYPLADSSLKMVTKGSYVLDYPVGAAVHFTAGRSLAGDKDAINTVNWGKQMGYCYFCISSSGTVFQSFPLNEWGHHAGSSYWGDLGYSLSKKLVGIEVCCAGRVKKTGTDVFESWFGEEYGLSQVRYSEKKDNIQPGYYHKYTNMQEESLLKLLLWLKLNNPDVFSLDYVLGHDEIAPNRKNDPGASLSKTMPEFREYLKEKYEDLIKG